MINVKDNNEEFKLLIISYLTEGLNDGDALRLKLWVEEDLQHREYFDEIKASWILAGKHSGELKIDSGLQWSTLKSKMKLESNPIPNRVKTKTKVLVLIGIAASWGIFFIIGSLLHGNSEKSLDVQLKTTEFTVPLGAKSIVKLPDGTTVWLNAGSKITYNQNFDKKDRNIRLVGEAYFSVATNKAKPFIVNTSGIIVRALGTRFNVKAYPEEKTITATLEEGKIDVQVINKSSKEKKQIVLTPNQKIVFYKKTNDLGGEIVNKNMKVQQAMVCSVDQNLEVDQNIHTELYTSWKDARWIIESMPLVKLTPMLERRFNMKFKFNSEDLENYNFTGTIEKETIEQILDAIRFTAPIDYQIRKDTILLTVNKHLKNQYSRLVKPKNK
jgi:transmembrane sensor